MYGDSGVMRKRAAQLREQGVDLRTMADRLVARTEALDWTGRAADALRARIRERATHLRELADDHDGAADALQSHLLEVDRLAAEIAGAERRAGHLAADGRIPAGLSTPPPGHRDWLTVELPGL
ncbi:MAG TPA: hypothetical protein VD864_08805 [Nocardioides sp.]|nr:hypothetical protein [Nocardioides sp.]